MKECHSKICYALGLMFVFTIIIGDFTLAFSIPRPLEPELMSITEEILIILILVGYNALVFVLWIVTGKWIHNHFVEKSFQFIKTKEEQTS